MDIIIFALLLFFAVIFTAIPTLFAFIYSHPWIALAVIAVSIVASATSKQRKKTAFGRLIASNLPYLISFIAARSDRKRDIVLNAKSILQEHFETATVRKIMQQLKKCNENGVSDTELKNACFALASQLNYNSRCQLYTILQQITGTPTPEEDAVLQRIAIMLNLAYSNRDSDYQSFYEAFRRFAEGAYSGYNAGSERQRQYSEDIDCDPYKILGLSKTASNDEIKKTYRRLCKQYHPDKTANLPENERAEAEKKIREIIAAYDKIKQERPGL